MNPAEHKLTLICTALKFLEVPNLAKKQELTNLISEHGKIYHLQIKPLKTAKKPLIKSLINFAEGFADMQIILNDLNHSVQ